MYDKFSVEQKCGHNSTVRVEQGTRGTGRYERDTLIFETDQKLDTGSGRAHTVREAIRRYCNERGYRLRDGDFERYGVEVAYDARHHSGILTYQLEERVRADERFQVAAAGVLQRRDVLCQQFGKQIKLLKNLVFALEEHRDDALCTLRDELIAVQVEILGSCDVPPQVSGFDRRRLFEPSYPLVEIRTPYYSGERRGELPESLDEALALI